jgi:hypothetical protein
MRADHHVTVGEIVAAIESGALNRVGSRSVRLSAEPYEKANELFSSALDPEAIAQYERYRETSVKKLRGEVQKLHKEAVAESGGSQRALDEVNASRVQDISVLPIDSSVWVDKPFLIWAHPYQEFDSTIGNGISSARFTYQSSSDSEFGLEFWYLWQNEENASARITVSGTIGINGELAAWADGSLLFGKHANCGIASRLRVWQWWHQPPTEPAQASTQSMVLDYCEATNWDTIISDVSRTTITNAQVGLVSYHGLVVPAHSSVVFTMLAHVTTDVSGGWAKATFEGGHYGVTCTGVLIEKSPAGGGGSPVVAPD